MLGLWDHHTDQQNKLGAVLPGPALEVAVLGGPATFLTVVILHQYHGFPKYPPLYMRQIKAEPWGGYYKGGSWRTHDNTANKD